MNPPKILFVAHGHPAFVAGGTELASHDLFRAWRTAGHEANFVGCVTRLHRDARSFTALQAVKGSANEFLLQVGGFDPFMLAQTDTTQFVSSFSELLQQTAPDIVHFHHFTQIGIDALALIRRLRPAARIVVTLHDYHLICANDGLMTTTTGALCERASSDACHACFGDIPAQRFALRRRHLDNLLGLVDGFVSPSHFLKSRFVDWGLPESRIEVIANAVPAATAVAAVEDRPRRIFGLFANLAPHKGALLALDAVKQITDLEGFELRIHGANLYREPGFTASLDTALATAGPQVAALGPYRRHELARMMAAVDWVVVPSTWWENAPLVILEAFRHGRPVITADIGGMAEMVHHDTDGLLFRARDPGDLARTLRRAATEAGLWERLARQVPAPPTPQDSVAPHGAFYSSLMATRAQAA